MLIPTIAASDTKNSVSLQHPIKILLVDDRPENLISLESMMENGSRTIIKANSGNEALKVALEDEIALILLDVQMPDMDGFEVARLLKENSRTKDISIIFVTALSKDEKFTIQGYEEGAVDYLHKPLDYNIVLAKVNVFERLFLQQKELKAANDKLQRTNKQLDEFVYVVSHDLKASLRGLASLATFLEEELGANPRQEAIDILNMMKSRTGRLQGLIDGILHYSRMGNVTESKETFSTKELVISIIDLLSPPANVRFEVADGLPEVTAEKIKLHEVFQNLISNSIKYNNKDNSVIKIEFQEFPTYFEFSVIDNGIGIKEEHQAKIFGIFQTLVPKDKVESTGIGLTIVKKIVEQQGGEVIVTSKFGEGSCFKFKWMKA
ncbi:MAG: response regulator [Bacteroidetes bacterium]|nr:response regulator [Bacteroidota bacterium]